GDDIAEHGRVRRTGANTDTDLSFDRGPVCPTIEKQRVLWPVHANHHSDATSPSAVEQPSWRHRVRAHRVHAVRCHECKVSRHGRFVRERITIRTRAKGAIGNAAHVELLIADEEKLAPDARALLRDDDRVCVSGLLRDDHYHSTLRHAPPAALSLAIAQAVVWSAASTWRPIDT